MTATAPAIPTPAPTPVWHMYRALVGVGILCGALIVTTYLSTKDIIQRNQVEMRQKAIFDVLPGATASRTFRYTEAGTFEAVPAEETKGELAFAGFDAAGKLIGVALEASGQGYADTVRVLYGYSLEQAAVIGLKLLESRETPGLGDRVETDENYVANFAKLDVSLTEDGNALQNQVQFVKSGQKQHPWQIDGITGATITSRAIADMLSASTEQWVARVAKNRAVFQPQAK